MAGAGTVALTAATAVGLVLAVAAAAKLRDGRTVAPFLLALGAGPGLSRAARAAVPAAELGCAGWLLSGAAPVAAAAAATALAAGFAVLLGVAWWRGVAEPCRCFGALDRSPSQRLSLARALLVLAGSLVALSAALLAGGAVVTGGAWAARGVGLVLALCTVVSFALLGEVAAFRSGVRTVLAARGGQLGDHRGQAR